MITNRVIRPFDHQPHFQLSEFFIGCSPVERQKALQDIKVVDNILRLCQILTDVRTSLVQLHLKDVPIRINSCYRDYSHNVRVGGALTSQHLSGSAVDIRCEFMSDLIFIIRNYVIFGQFIIYDNFVHVSLPDSDHLNHIIDKRSKK